MQPELNNPQKTFLQNINHELRTPIAIILGYADLLRDGELGALATEQQRAILAIANSASELKKLVERITVLLRSEAQTAFFMRLSLAKVTVGVVEAHLQLAKQRNIVLEFSSATDLPDIMGDQEHLRQAIGCVVENAIKFTSKGGRVIVELTSEESQVRLKVSDTGIGIAPEKLAEIFNPFYQVDSSSTRQYGGLGLGLTVTKAVIKAHSGQIQVSSQPGQGSCLTMKLPVIPETNHAGKPLSHKINPRRILVVDDEKYITLMLREALEDIPDCEVVTSSNGEEALHLLKAQSFDMLITDYRMPGIDGLTLASQVCHLSPDTTIVVLTAYSSAVLLEQAANIQIQHVLNKPVKLAEIRQVASQVLNRNSNSA